MCALVWCDISSSIAFIDVCFVYSGFYDLRKPCVQGYLGQPSGEELACRRERNNIHSNVIVGHISRAISAACYVFFGQARSTICQT